jgi:5-hydroxyisourate hydrolase
LSRYISTHVLDVSIGKPGVDIEVTLEFLTASGWQELARDRTNSDGRATNLGAGGASLETGIYRLSFDTKSYLKSQNRTGFFPHVSIAFEVVNTEEHYHVPLLLSPFGYSTYRGS